MSVCVLSVLLVACGDGSLSATEEDLLATINQERTSRGLSAVTLNDDLLCAARHHSEDIGARMVCSHDDADGSGPGERVEACGGGGWSGEIVACGQTTPRAAVDGWLGSPGHNAIMLDPDQVEIGVAMHGNYWTAIFDR
jgi:uncharacterized protein YkwD